MPYHYIAMRGTKRDLGDNFYENLGTIAKAELARRIESPTDASQPSDQQETFDIGSFNILYRHFEPGLQGFSRAESEMVIEASDDIVDMLKLQVLTHPVEVTAMYPTAEAMWQFTTKRKEKLKRPVQYQDAFHAQIMGSNLDGSALLDYKDSDMFPDNFQVQGYLRGDVAQVLDIRKALEDHKPGLTRDELQFMRLSE